MRVVGNLQVPTKHSKDILQQSWSSPLRSDSSWDDQAGEAGPVELKLSGGQESQTKNQGLPNYHSSETVVEAARRGASGQNKRATLMTCLLRKGELKNSSLLDWKRAKSSMLEKKPPWVKTKELLTLDSGCGCRRERWSRWRWWWVRSSRDDHKSM
jgi:hypothetical protein